MTYWNAVTGIQTAGMWHGKAQRFELPMSEIAKKGGCAVLLQSVGKDGMPGPILGAAFIRSPQIAVDEVVPAATALPALAAGAKQDRAIRRGCR